MIALGKLANTILGSGPIVNGLAVTPTSPASLQVNVAPGEIYSLQAVDGSAFSTLPADSHQIIKQGILLDAIQLTLAAPGTSGQSISYLIQATYQDQDANPAVLPYYNSANTNQALSGPGNNGQSQNTVRKGVVVVQAKAGVSAATGSQVAPAPDSGFVGLYVVTVSYGQTQITSGNISLYTSAPFLQTTLSNAAGLALSNVFSQPQTVPSAVSSGHALNLGQAQGLFVGKNSAGNVGVGTTPSSSWASSFAALQLGAVAAVASDPNSGYIGSNWVSTASGDVRIQSGSAVRVMLNSALGTATVQYAGSGAAGSAITWQTIFSGSATGVSLPNGVTFPTASPGDNSTNGATTGFVQTAISGKANSATTLAGYGITDGVGKDAQGNIGVGTTTQTWDAMFPAIQQNARSVYAADANSTYMGGNWYHASGAFKRLGSGFGLMYQQNAATGAHTFNIAATGAANSTLTWTQAMTIDANGNVGINTTPLTWGGSSPAIQLNAKTAIAADANSTYYGTNWYAGSGGADTAIANGYGVQYFQNSATGAHTWRTSASVSAGGAISFINAMVLSAAGILSVPAGMTTYTQSGSDNSANVATTAQVQSAIGLAVAANPASTGGINFVGGYQIRHGAVALGAGTSPQSVTFSSAFPNFCWGVVITAQGTQAGPTATSCAQSYSKYGFTIQNYTGIPTTFSYIAIGA